MVVVFFKWFFLLGFRLAFFLCMTRVGFFPIFVTFLSAGTLLTAFCFCVHILERLHDFIELSHPTVKEFRVSHFNINKEETEMTQQLCSSHSSFIAGIGDGFR